MVLYLAFHCMQEILISKLIYLYIPEIFQEADLILSGERSECTKTYMRTRIHAKIKNGFLKGEE